MSSATEYQAVPTTTTANTTKQPSIWSENLRRCTGYPTIFTMVVLCVGFGVPLIIFGVIEYVKVDNFSTKPGTCHVNAIGTEQKTGWRLSSSAFPVWNVDVVQELQSDSETKNLVVLHSNLKIRGHGDYRNRPLTLEDAGQLYSVSRCDHNIIQNLISEEKLKVKLQSFFSFFL
jgi:hypothetical protein